MSLRTLRLPAALLLLIATSAKAQQATDLTPPASWPEWSPEKSSGKNAERPEGGEGEREERERDEIETDRDSFTPATTTAGRGRLIFESAYSFIDNRRSAETHSLPEAVFRYGLTERVELRFGFNYEVGGAANDVSSGGAAEDEATPSRKRLERESAVSYGVKIRATDQSGWIPGSSVILQGVTPTSGAGTDSQFIGTYVFGWELPRRWKLDAAMRYATDSEGEDRFATWAPSVVLKVPVMERVNVHAEYFGLFSSGKEKDFSHQFFSPGVHYLVTDDLEVGVRVGWGLNDQSARFFVNTGIGVRF